MAIVLVLHCRSGANIARSCIRDSGHGHFSTHGDDLPSRLHLWRRFWISPPPTATFPQRRWEKKPFADDSAAPTDDGTHAVAKDKLMRTAFKALHGRRRQGRRRRRRQGRRRGRRQGRRRRRRRRRRQGRRRGRRQGRGRGFQGQSSAPENKGFRPTTRRRGLAGLRSGRAISVTPFAITSSAPDAISG